MLGKHLFLRDQLDSFTKIGYSSRSRFLRTTSGNLSEPFVESKSPESIYRYQLACSPGEKLSDGLYRLT